MRLPKSLVAAIVCLLVLTLSSPVVFAKPIDVKGGKVTIDTEELAKWLERGDGDNDDDDREWSREAFANSPVFGLLSRFFGALKFRLVHGTVTATNTSKGQPTITIKTTNDQQQTYTTGNGVNVWLDGKQARLSDLDAGEEVALLLNPSGHVVTIVANSDGETTPPPTSGNSQTGTVTQIINQGSLRALTVQLSSGQSTYTLAANARVSFRNWSVGTFADIRVGDRVTFRLADGKISELDVETVTTSDVGQITAISASAISIKRDSGTTRAYPLGQNMTLTIDGITQPAISSVLVGDRAELLLRDEVVRSLHVIPATNLSGTVQSVGTTGDYRYVSIKKANNETVTHLLTTNATVSFTNWPAGTFADIREGDTVRARLVDGKITNLIIETMTSSASGTITAISNSAVAIRTNDANPAYVLGLNMTLTIQGVSQPTLSDVRVGDVANLSLRDGIVRAMHVVPANLTYGTIQSIIKTGDYRGVIIRKADGNLVTYELAANAKVSFKNLMAATFDDLRVGDLVTVRLAEGKIIDLVIESVATSDRGTITAISASSVTIRRDNNTTQSHPLGQNMALTIAGVSQPKLSDVLVGDRVELGLRDSVVFAMQVTPAASVSGTIETIVNSSTTRALTIKKANAEIVTYTLATNATVVIKDQPDATFASLLVGDTVSARIIDNKIVRLEAEYIYTSVEGTVTLLNLTISPKALYLLPTNGSASQAFTLANPCPVTIPGLASPTLSQIKIGDRAALRIRGGLVRSIAVNPQLSIFNAIFVRVTGSNTTPAIEVIRDGNVVNYTLAAPYTLVVPSKTNPSLSDVGAGKTVKITMENNLVIRLEVIQ